MKDNPYVFPALHHRKADLPPVFLSTCGADPLRDDGTVFKIALDKAKYVWSSLFLSHT